MVMDWRCAWVPFFNETEDKLPRRPRVKSDVGYEKQENAPVVCQGRKSVETP
jgi:hypothetical protein